jgi:hypothetical protein
LLLVVAVVADLIAAVGIFLPWREDADGRYLQHADAFYDNFIGVPLVVLVIITGVLVLITGLLVRRGAPLALSVVLTTSAVSLLGYSLFGAADIGNRVGNGRAEVAGYGHRVVLVGSAVLLVAVVGALPSLIRHRSRRPTRPQPVPGQPQAGAPPYRELYTAEGQKVLVPFAPVARPTNGLAVTSLILALVLGLFLAGLPSIITGHIARRQIRQRGESGNGLAVAGLVLGYVALAIDLALIAAISIAAA